MEAEQMSLFGDTRPQYKGLGGTMQRRVKSYEEFLAKFENADAHTTDDCLTPPEVYEAVLEWCCGKYGIDPANVVRPFYPGGDYENFPYEENDVVVDNPPFSILAKICGFYMERGIKFFLFAPHLTLFQGHRKGMTCLVCDAKTRYANGAEVNTSFRTNLSPGIGIRTCPDLRRAITEAQPAKKRKMPVNVYPDNLVTVSSLSRAIRRGEPPVEIPEDSLVFVRGLDDMKARGCGGLYGGGFLTSDRYAGMVGGMEKYAKEHREGNEVQYFGLSEREKRIIEELNENERTTGGNQEVPRG